jgi:rhamnose utilization protein RhaD (predicted bifunctional aldolase and dehydrogenase)
MPDFVKKRLGQLTALSHRYGRDMDFIIAGGGNTSVKCGGEIYVKASGASLGDITGEDFVGMRLDALREALDKTYAGASAEVEEAVLSAMNAARLPGQEEKRPSVEALLHALFPWDFVAHTHPCLVNGLTCSQNGERAFKKLFGGTSLWIPSINPGYTLSRAAKDAIDAFRQKQGKPPKVIFLQNHGIFVGGDGPEGIVAEYDRVLRIIAGETGAAQRAFSAPAAGSAVSAEIGDILRGLASRSDTGGSPWATEFLLNDGIAAVIKNRQAFAPVSGPVTPDHIVYAGSDPLFVAVDSPANAKETVTDAWEVHFQKTGRIPKIAAVQNLGVFGLGTTEKAARLALLLFQDAIKIARFSESFGGPRCMEQDKIDFINNWEVERYRARISMK